MITKRVPQQAASPDFESEEDAPRGLSERLIIGLICIRMKPVGCGMVRMSSHSNHPELVEGLASSIFP